MRLSLNQFIYAEKHVKDLYVGIHVQVSFPNHESDPLSKVRMSRLFPDSFEGLLWKKLFIKDSRKLLDMNAKPYKQQIHDKWAYMSGVSGGNDNQQKGHIWAPVSVGG